MHHVPSEHFIQFFAVYIDHVLLKKEDMVFPSEIATNGIRDENVANFLANVN